MESSDTNPEEIEREAVKAVKETRREMAAERAAQQAAQPATHGIELEEWHRWWKTRGASELRVLLMTHWDPIGVNGIPEASDEYDSYLGPLAKRLREGADARAVCQYLSDIQTEGMEIPARADQLADVGERVLGWYSVEMQR